MSCLDHTLHCWTFAGWEPDRAYRRGGSRSTRMFGNGAWVDAWRRRLTSRDTVRLLLDSGITVAVTHFYKGFGIRADGAEWPRLRQFVDLCHEQGVQVWGYVQGRSLFYETLQAEIPEVMEWAARRRDGSPDTWSGQYYRLAACLNAASYREYICTVLRLGLTEIGLDGIHNDNSYYSHCYCPRCTALFRTWLASQPLLLESLGLDTAEYVLPPPLPPEPVGWVVDPLQIAWMEFGTQTRLAAYRQFYETVKACNPDAVYETNPAFPKRVGFKARLAMDPSREAQICDAACAENSNLPRVDNERIITQTEAYLCADAGGYRVMHTSWRHAGGSHRPVNTPGLLWTGLAEEFSHHAAMLGNNWLLRPTGDGDRILADIPEMRVPHAEAVHFFRRLHDTLHLNERRQWAELALFVEPDTLTLAGDTDLTACRAALMWLLCRRIPVLIVFAGQPVPDSVRWLWVCQQTCLPDTSLQQISAFAAQPGHQVLLSGSSGQCDQWHVPRNAGTWQQWRRSLGFTADSGTPLAWADRNGEAGQARGEIEWPTPEAGKEAEAALQGAGWNPQFSAELPGHCLVNTELTGDGRFLIHLRDQAGEDEPLTGARIHLGPKLAENREVRFWTPGNENHLLHGAPQRSGCIIDVPPFRHYALLLVEPIGNTPG